MNQTKTNKTKILRNSNIYLMFVYRKKRKKKKTEDVTKQKDILDRKSKEQYKQKHTHMPLFILQFLVSLKIISNKWNQMDNTDYFDIRDSSLPLICFQIQEIYMVSFVCVLLFIKSLLPSFVSHHKLF